MTQAELWKVEALIAQARAASTQRHNDFLTAYADLMTELRDFWYSEAPAGVELSPALRESIDQFSKRFPS